jgi:hypothetical protein
MITRAARACLIQMLVIFFGLTVATRPASGQG